MHQYDKEKNKIIKNVFIKIKLKLASAQFSQPNNTIVANGKWVIVIVKQDAMSNFKLKIEI